MPSGPTRWSWRATAARSCWASATSEMFFASDPAALVRHTDERRPSRRRRDRRGARRRLRDAHAGGRAPPPRRPSTIPWKDEAFDKGEFTHYMRKEIGEQPEAVRRTLSGRLDTRFQTTHLGGIELAARDLLDIRRVKILGCGAAYLAGRDRRAPDRAARPHPGRRRARLGVPLPQRR